MKRQIFLSLFSLPKLTSFFSCSTRVTNFYHCFYLIMLSASYIISGHNVFFLDHDKFLSFPLPPLSFFHSFSFSLSTFYFSLVTIFSLTLRAAFANSFASVNI